MLVLMLSTTVLVQHVERFFFDDQKEEERSSRYVSGKTLRSRRRRRKAREISGLIGPDAMDLPGQIEQLADCHKSAITPGGQSTPTDGKKVEKPNPTAGLFGNKDECRWTDEWRDGASDKDNYSHDWHHGHGANSFFDDPWIASREPQ